MYRPRRVLRGFLAMALFLLIPATVASSATSTLYKGKTSQHKRIRFTVSNGNTVVGLKIKIDEKCPDGHILTETITIAGSIPITNSAFSGKFVPPSNPHGEHTNIKAKFVGKKAKGSIAATSFSKNEGKLCHGKVKFKASPH